MTSTRSLHPVKDTATTARHLIAQVPVDTEHLNRCVIGDDPEKSARAYLASAYLAAHGEDIAVLDAGLTAAQKKLQILHTDLDKVTARYDDTPPELPPDKGDLRPLMPLSAKLYNTGEALAIIVVWSISIALVTTQMMDKFVRLATAPLMALLVAASVSIAPSFSIKWWLQAWTVKGTPAAKRLLATLGACAGVAYLGIVSHMVRPELAQADPDDLLKELLAVPPSAAPLAESISAAPGANETASTLPGDTGSHTTAGRERDNWFLFCGLFGEMCVAAGLMQNLAHRTQQYRPASLKPHPVKVQAGQERAALLNDIEVTSGDYAESAGRRALHDHACQLFVEEQTGRVLTARHLFDDQRKFACL